MIYGHIPRFVWEFFHSLPPCSIIPPGKNNNRMSVISITDLDAKASISALRRMRKNRAGNDGDNEAILAETTSIIGGRLSFLSKVSRAKDMIAQAKRMMHEEKQWLLSQIGLIQDCDDDVMDEQKLVFCVFVEL